MYKFSGHDIELTRGDSFSFSISFEGRMLPETAEAVFSVKKRAQDAETIIEKKMAVIENKVTIYILPQDTSELRSGTYYWDVRVIVPGVDVTEVRTPMEYAAFQVLEVIGNG